MLVSLKVLMRLFVWFKGDIILAGSFGVDKAEWQTWVAPCQMRQMCRAYWKEALRLMV